MKNKSSNKSMEAKLEKLKLVKKVEPPIDLLKKIEQKIDFKKRNTVSSGKVKLVAASLLAVIIIEAFTVVKSRSASAPLSVLLPENNNNLYNE